MIKIVGVHKIKAQEPCFIIETSFDQPCLTYDWDEVTQEDEEQPKLNWQASYDEQKLDKTGKRWAFFFHYLDLSKPLLTPDGPIKLPEPTEMPRHLRRIKYKEP